jgi:hypothetical protein
MEQTLYLKRAKGGTREDEKRMSMATLTNPANFLLPPLQQKKNISNFQRIPLIAFPQKYTLALSMN